MLHDLPARPETVHWGYFDAAKAPALTVKSGDIIRAEAVTHHAGDAPDLMMDDAVRAIYETIPHEDRNPGVHIMTGPIYIEDARPGDMLEVRYLQMIPRFRYGANAAAHWGQLYREFDKERITIYELDNASNTAHALYAFDYPGKLTIPGKVVDQRECCRQPALAGVRVPVRPHLGTAGVAPDAPGRVSTVEPGLHGGNIDNWRIGAGATMYYPVAVPGALFSIGDPHASQGDSELCGTAIECSLTGDFQLILHKSGEIDPGAPFCDLTYPLVETAHEWILHGFSSPNHLTEFGQKAQSHIYMKSTLDEAMRDAFRKARRFLMSVKGLSEDEAVTLISVAIDFGITQVVNGNWGVHAIIRKSLFTGARSGAQPR